jgi:hypothetical protein
VRPTQSEQSGQTAVPATSPTIPNDAIGRLVRAASEAQLDPWLYENAAYQRLQLVAALDNIVPRECPIVTHHRSDCEWCAGITALKVAGVR